MGQIIPCMHVEYTCEEASMIDMTLGRMRPNVEGPGHTCRLLKVSAVITILLNAVPCWGAALRVLCHPYKLSAVYRRRSSAFSIITSSFVISGKIPTGEILTDEGLNNYLYFVTAGKMRKRKTHRMEQWRDHLKRVVGHTGWSLPPGFCHDQWKILSVAVQV